MPEEVQRIEISFEPKFYEALEGLKRGSEPLVEVQEAFESFYAKHFGALPEAQTPPSE